MKRNNNILLALSALVVFCLYKIMDSQMPDCPPPEVKRIVEKMVVRPDRLEEETPKKTNDRHHIEQRNSLSRLMNDLRREMRLSLCDMLRLNNGTIVQQNGQMVMVNSEVCSKVIVGEGRPEFDKNLTHEMARITEAGRVAQFGDSAGKYKRHMDVLTLTASFDSYDDSPHIENRTDNNVHFLDLTVPQYGLPLYDWVICLQLGQVPEESEDIAMDNIVRHARVGVFLSWAPPAEETSGQGSPGKKTPEELERLLKARGFTVDAYSTRLLKRAAFRPWYSDNVRVFERDPDNTADEEDT